jgi:hypothetical protein
MVAGSIGFVVLGFWIAGLFGPPPRPGREWLGWFAAVFFSLCAAVGVRRLFDSGDQIVVDRNGIFWRQWSEMTIPWSAIRSFERRSVRNQHFLSLHLKDASQFPRSGMGLWSSGLNKGLGFGDVAITAAGTDRSFDELLAAVERFARRDDALPPGFGRR